MGVLIEGVEHEARAVRQAGLVDPVADALGDVHADLDAVLLQRVRGALGQDGRQHLVAVAMDQQHRRLRPDLRRQRLGRGQHAGEADDAGQRPGAAQPDMQRHHGALAEADHDGLRFVEPILRHRVVEELLGEGRGRAHARRRDLGIEARDAEPLEAHRIALARVRRVGRVEHRVGHQRRQHGREADQVVAVGAVAVQQDHEMAGLAAGMGAVAGSVDLLGHVAFFSFAPQSGMLRR
jgi:hypothetical protein